MKTGQSRLMKSGQTRVLLTLRKKSQAAQKQIKKLERELRHKEKALAETAALLVLRKKLDALWENDNGDD